MRQRGPGRHREGAPRVRVEVRQGTGGTQMAWSARRLDRHLDELEEQGYTLIPGMMDRAVTAEIRDYIEAAIAAGRHSEPGRGTVSHHHRVCHPMEEPLVLRLATDADTVTLLRRALRSEQLRLRQQMFMRTDPRPEPPPSRVHGWHIDTPFLPEEWEATPRRTYLQLFVYCSPVRPGGAATMVVPGSHRLTLAAAGRAAPATEEERWAFARRAAAEAGVDLGRGIELCAEEGDVALFSPMLLHSGSSNTTTEPRYIYHSSYFDAAAAWVRTLPPAFYDTFPEGLLRAVPPEHAALFER